MGIHLLPIPGTDASVVSDPRYPEILGDRVVTSDHPLVRKMTIMVDRIDLAGPGDRRTEYECPPNAEAVCNHSAVTLVYKPRGASSVS